MVKAAETVKAANEVAATSANWADLSNALFDPIEGLLVKAYPTAEARAQFVQTDAYRQIQHLLTATRQRSGLLAGATPTKSGRFVVRLPKSLHAALEREASAEGVSLNQLAVAKLAVQLESLAGDTLGAVIRAFAEVRDGYSVDRVVADPELDRRFLERSRELGAPGSDFELNHLLFHARKNRKLQHLPRTRRYTPRDSDEFEYASEIALRYIQLREQSLAKHSVSLDRIICDPELAIAFDEAASRLAPGFTPLEYRWAALGLRKARRLAADAQDVALSRFEQIGATRSVRLNRVPESPGLYLFGSEIQAMFVGHTANLRHRIDRHFEYGGKSGLPEWLQEVNQRPLNLGILPMPAVDFGERQKAELGAIRVLKPIFNLGLRILHAA